MFSIIRALSHLSVLLLPTTRWLEYIVNSDQKDWGKVSQPNHFLKSNEIEKMKQETTSLIWETVFSNEGAIAYLMLKQPFRP